MIVTQNNGTGCLREYNRLYLYTCITIMYIYMILIILGDSTNFFKDTTFTIQKFYTIKEVENPYKTVPPLDVVT